MTSDIDTQEKHVRWVYVVQWAALLFPPAIVLSLIYLLVLRGHVTHRELRSHVNWQLTTCGIVLAMIPLMLVLLVIGMSGFNTDDPISILATFVMAGASAVFLPWMLYRLLRGTTRFNKQLPMKAMFP